MAETKVRREVEVDTALAENYAAVQKQLRSIEWVDSDIRGAAGQKRSYEHYGRGHRRVWSGTFEEAEPIVRAKVEGGYDDSGMSYHDFGNAVRSIENLDKARAEIARLREERRPLEEEFDANPWSRFFLVTSSAGHIHSSMGCSTCNFKTTYAWLPELSGLTEKDAVDSQGPLLCSVCFPDAPVEWTVGKKKGAK